MVNDKSLWEIHDVSVHREISAHVGVPKVRVTFFGEDPPVARQVIRFVGVYTRVCHDAPPMFDGQKILKKIFTRFPQISDDIEQVTGSPGHGPPSQFEPSFLQNFHMFSRRHVDEHFVHGLPVAHDWNLHTLQEKRVFKK
jgi:hypothetical protein